MDNRSSAYQPLTRTFMRLNRKAVSTLLLPPDRPYLIVWDEDLPGFGVRINPTSKVWVVQYRSNGKSRRKTIGRVDTIPPEAARDHAKKTLAQVHLGADPHSDRVEAEARRAVTLEKVTARYLQNVQGRLKPRYYDEVCRHFRKDWAALAQFPIQKIDRGLVAARLEEIAQESGPIAANRARATLSALYSYALGMGLSDNNPVIGTLKLGEEVKRDHVMSDAELSAIWNACLPSDYGRIVRLLLLTGQRRDEVGSIQWTETNFETSIWTIPGARTKNRRLHEVPLPKEATEILRRAPHLLGREFVFGTGRGGFSGWSKAKEELDSAAKGILKSLRPWRLHDLRRTAATGMANLGVSPHVIEAVLNHVSGSRAGVAGIYNRATYREEKRQALECWAGHVSRIVKLNV
jgi:integrase